MGKIKYGLNDVHYAVLKEDGTYGTPVKMEGAVNLTLEPQGEELKEYADDMLYFSQSANNGYSGSLELEYIGDDFKVDVLGETLTPAKLLVENSDVLPNNIALGCYMHIGNVKRYFWFYNCSVTRASQNGQTKGESIEAQHETLNISIAGDADGNVKINSTEATSATIIDKWFEEVILPNITNSGNTPTP